MGGYDQIKKEIAKFKHLNPSLISAQKKSIPDEITGSDGITWVWIKEDAAWIQKGHKPEITAKPYKSASSFKELVDEMYNQEFNLNDVDDGVSTITGYGPAPF